MFSRIAALVLAVGLLTTTGCASGRPYSVAADEAGYSESGRTVWSDLARLEFSKDARVEFPARMVVVDESTSNWRARTRNGEAARLERVVERLGHERDALSYVSPLFGADLDRAQSDDGEDWRRMAAAQHQADLMLITQWKESVVPQGNVLKVLDLLLLPMLILPSHPNRIEVSLEGAVVDVRNGLVHASALSTGRSEIASTLAAEDDDVRLELDDLHAAAVEDLVDKLRSRFDQVRHEAR